MCQFVETICLENGVPRNLSYHEERLNRTRQHFWQDCKPLILAPYLNNLPSGEGRQKVRVVYSRQGITEVIANQYIMRNVTSLRLVTSETIEYTFKSTDRKVLNDLAAQRGECDEVLIVKHGEVTDTSYTNVAFLDGKQWYTPVHPILQGTMRASLLAKGLMVERQILANALCCYSAIMLFNAMIAFGELVLPMSAIKH